MAKSKVDLEARLQNWISSDISIISPDFLLSVEKSPLTLEDTSIFFACMRTAHRKKWLAIASAYVLPHLKLAENY